jgi:plasmid stabilization system protein ParE
MWLAGFRIWEHDAAAEVEPDLRDIIVLIAEYREEFKITEEAPLGNRPAGPSQAQDRWQALTENIREIQNPTLRYTVEDGRLGMSI